MYQVRKLLFSKTNNLTKSVVQRQWVVSLNTASKTFNFMCSDLSFPQSDEQTLSTRRLTVCPRHSRHYLTNALYSRSKLLHYEVSRRWYCSKDYDIKDDPEAKSLLKEIVSDFQVTNKTENNYSKANLDAVKSMDQDIPEDSTRVDLKSEIEDVEDFQVEEIAPAYVPPIDLKRGVRGVFDLDELLTLLRKENARDIAVIPIPPEAQFGDHMVIVSAMSLRHLRSISTHIKWIHKKKKGDGDFFLKVEGFETAHDWHAMDLGNIILHIFMPETRQQYDLESLWTNWGQPGQGDDKEEYDPYAISPDDKFWQSLEQSSDDPKSRLK